MENGQWPPHLHFQVVVDMEVPALPASRQGAIGRKGDYPGVCRLPEKERFLNNCPDPDLILQMMRHAM